MNRYKVEQIRVALDFTDKSLKNKIARMLGIFPNEIISVKILRKSLDSRKKPPVYVISAEIEITKPLTKQMKFVSTIELKEEKNNSAFIIPHSALTNRPVIVGFGPAGIAAAYVLAKRGLRPIVFERGEDITSRSIKVDRFWNEGILDENSNVLFGEGGAGLFSDGKLTSRSKDVENRNAFLEILVRHGAAHSVLTDTRAHIGSDKLREIIKSIREEIETLGGEVKFNSTLTDLRIKDKKLCGIYINGALIPTQTLLLAIGHSARDTVSMLLKYIHIEAKPFSIGARVEFEQEVINKLQYGKSAVNLPAASFSLTYNPNNNSALTPQGSLLRFRIPHSALHARACYTFCMCPGGEVISCSAKAGTLSCNGMSYAARSMKFGNAAFLVPVGANQLSIEGLERIERRVFERGGKNYALPAQNLASFLYDKENKDCGFSPHRYKMCDISEILPDFVEKTLRIAIPDMLKTLGKIDFSRAAIIAAETGSSSSVRITRNSEGDNPQSLQSISLEGLFPCGEGAGYSGGIVSSGIDGIKCANYLGRNYFQRH